LNGEKRAMRIDLERLRKDIEELGRIGRGRDGGINRPSFSRADLEAREWLKDRIREAGLELREDGAGNIFGRLEGEGKTIMAGSHLDTVINGGMYDGAVGVLSALECLRRIKEEKVRTRKPLEAASFTDEEGNLVGDFLGSRAFVGPPERDLLEKGRTAFGVPFPEVLEATEFSTDTILRAHEQRPDLEVFLELHIEQGPVLESENRPVGIVDRIAGKRDWLCRFEGAPAHAGTTPFELRRDAFLGLADYALKSTRFVASRYYGSMLTVGRVQVHPGAFSIIPGRVDFTLDFRSVSEETLAELEKELLALAEEVASTRGLEFSHRVQDTTDPVRIPERMVEAIREESEKLGYDYLVLPSGAGHDTQIIARVAEPGMIFIPCEDGISHSPRERIKWEDLEKGANLLLHLLLRFSS